MVPSHNHLSLTASAAIISAIISPAQTNLLTPILPLDQLKVFQKGAPSQECGSLLDYLISRSGIDFPDLQAFPISNYKIKHKIRGDKTKGIVMCKRLKKKTATDGDQLAFNRIKGGPRGQSKGRFICENGEWSGDWKKNSKDGQGLWEIPSCPDGEKEGAWEAFAETSMEAQLEFSEQEKSNAIIELTTSTRSTTSTTKTTTEKEIPTTKGVTTQWDPQDTATTKPPIFTTMPIWLRRLKLTAKDTSRFSGIFSDFSSEPTTSAFAWTTLETTSSAGPTDDLFFTDSTTIEFTNTCYEEWPLDVDNCDQCCSDRFGFTINMNRLDNCYDECGADLGIIGYGSLFAATQLPPILTNEVEEIRKLPLEDPDLGSTKI